MARTGAARQQRLKCRAGEVVERGGIAQLRPDQFGNQQGEAHGPFSSRWVGGLAAGVASVAWVAPGQKCSLLDPVRQVFLRWRKTVLDRPDQCVECAIDRCRDAAASPWRTMKPFR